MDAKLASWQAIAHLEAQLRAKTRLIEQQADDMEQQNVAFAATLKMMQDEISC